MTLSQVVESYIAYKRSLGKDFKSKAATLRAFVKSVGDRDIRRVNPCSVRRFLDGSGPVTASWFYKYQTLATFYRYAQAHHYVLNSPLPRSKPQSPEKFQPYIYTNDDMRKLIDAADSRHRYTWFLTPNTIRTLLLLLYGTGLRISEALRLNIEDHCCPATSRTDSIGCKYLLSRYRSPSLEVPVKWAFSRTELG